MLNFFVREDNQKKVSKIRIQIDDGCHGDEQAQAAENSQQETMHQFYSYKHATIATPKS